MPMPQKRRRLRRPRFSRSPLEEGLSRRRLDEDGASLSGSLVDSDSSSTTSPVDGGSPPPGLPDEPVMSSAMLRYHQIITLRLAQLQLPDGADGSDLAGSSGVPSRGILEALTRKSFHDDDLRAALLKFQCQHMDTDGPDNMGLDSDSGESEPDDVIRDEKYTRAREVLGARMAEIDTYTELDQEQTNKLHVKYALYRIKAAMLLKGMPAYELGASALEHMYPPELIMENNAFFHYVDDGYFGWYFDSELCKKESLSDYQRLVLFNDGGDEYTSWSRYRAFYNTPEADRDYLRYWETLVKKTKWLKKYVLKNESSYVWSEIRSRASTQAVRIAAEFPHMTMELAGVGLAEYIWNMRTYLLFVKDLDWVFYEIWRQINVYHQNFRDALEHVYNFRDALEHVYVERSYPARERNMKYELEHGNSNLELLFHQCTGGLSKDVPEYTARKLIAQEIHWRGGLSGTYAQYARKKLKIAELLGLIARRVDIVKIDPRRTQV